MAVSSDVKLYAYNEALRHLEARALTSVSDNTETRRVLDAAWGGGDELVIRALTRADWKFARRSVESAYDAATESGFGFAYAHNIPDDFVRLSAISSDPYFRAPLVDAEYQEEAGRWLTDHPSFYLRYVSKGGDYGLNSGLWTEDFTAYLGAFLAYQAAGRISGSRSSKADAAAAMDAALREAKSSNTMGDGVKFPPRGSWITARRAGYISRRGNRA